MNKLLNTFLCAVIAIMMFAGAPFILAIPYGVYLLLASLPWNSDSVFEILFMVCVSIVFGITAVMIVLMYFMACKTQIDILRVKHSP